MPENEKSEEPLPSEPSETTLPTIGKQTRREMVLNAKEIPRDHPLYKTGWMVGLQTLRPSSDKPSNPEPKLSPEELLEDEDDDRINRLKN